MISSLKSMATSTIAFAVFAILFLLSGAYYLINSYWRLRQLPGPWQARFTNLWYAKVVLSGSLDSKIGGLFDRYGILTPSIILIKNGPMQRLTFTARDQGQRSGSVQTRL